MAAKRRRKKNARSPRRARAGSAGIVQKALVALSGILVVLCAASVTYSFYFRIIRGDVGDRDRFRIEVLNGTGTGGLAHAAKRSLQRRKIDVIEVGNAERFDYPESILIARKPQVDLDALGRILGCRNVVIQLREGTIEDATLILGADFRELNLDWQLESDLLE